MTGKRALSPITPLIGSTWYPGKHCNIIVSAHMLQQEHDRYSQYRIDMTELRIPLLHSVLVQPSQGQLQNLISTQFTSLDAKSDLPTCITFGPSMFPYADSHACPCPVLHSLTAAIHTAHIPCDLNYSVYMSHIPPPVDPKT
jgi:hypothetical protein